MIEPRPGWSLSALALLVALLLAAAAGTSGQARGAVRGEPVDAQPYGSNARSVLFDPGSLQTAILDPVMFSSSNPGPAFTRIRAAGATAVRLVLFWRYTAPDSEERTRPNGFNPQNPGDAAYRWEGFDRQVKLAVSNGLEPIVSVVLAPTWAERSLSGEIGTRLPDAHEYGLFAKAAAIRYSGWFAGLPRVRYWQVWNEPNLNLFLNPQSPELYRRMVNAFADAVHGVHPDNLVVAGGLSPFGFRGVAVPPLQFMRSLLCMSGGANPRPVCRKRVEIDVWSHHPYTSGGPTHRARQRDDVSLGDLPRMRRLLESAVRSGNIVSRQKVRFWVTEFSWDSSPPDPLAVPTKLHARWVSEALYRMWQAGVSLVTWFQLRDDPLAQTQFQSGLYFASSREDGFGPPKLALRAFRFPFVAFQSGGTIRIWGRTPSGRPGSVLVERASGLGWRRVAVLRTDRNGIFTSMLTGPPGGSLRARLANGRDHSVSFSLLRPPDRYFWPFGCGGILPCTK